MKRTACLVLSRYHSNTQKENIEGVISALTPDLQQKYINKLYAKAIEHCLPVITMDEAQKVNEYLNLVLCRRSQLFA